MILKLNPEMSLDGNAKNNEPVVGPIIVCIGVQLW